jgi:hypothetical protein
MCPAHGGLSYDSYRDGVAHLVDAGEPFGEVEEAIEHAELAQDQKAALWLLAFSKRDRSVEGRDERATLVGVSYD